MEYLDALEASGFSMWVKESSTAYVAVLAFHSIGMCFLVGISGATAMRTLGIAHSIPLEPMKEFFPLMYAGFCINALTGTVLLCLYPTKFVVDPITYIKLAAIVVAVFTIRKLKIYLFDGGMGAEAAAETKQAKMLAGTVLTVWLIAITSGRLMAYGLTTKLQTLAAVFVVVCIALLFLRIVGRKLGWIESSKGGMR